MSLRVQDHAHHLFSLRCQLISRLSCNPDCMVIMSSRLIAQSAVKRVEEFFQGMGADSFLTRIARTQPSFAATRVPICRSLQARTPNKVSPFFTVARLCLRPVHLLSVYFAFSSASSPFVSLVRLFCGQSA